MERVDEILRSLFRRALSEEAREAPALVDIIIERACGRFEPRVGAQFANGYRAWAALRPADCYAFCERHSAWDLESLRRALLREGQRIYASVIEESRQRQQRERAALVEQIRRRTEELERHMYWPRRRAPAAREEADGWLRRRETQSRLMEWWSQRRSRFASPIFFDPSISGDVGSKDAKERGLRLLKQNLTPLQREQYEKHRYFDVLGGKSGRRYRVWHGHQMNIEQLDKNGKHVCGWCFMPQGRLVAGDVMLAQKVALELFENEALRIANRF
jgi:hypothetical protein